MVHLRNSTLSMKKYYFIKLLTVDCQSQISHYELILEKLVIPLNQIKNELFYVACNIKVITLQLGIQSHCSFNFNLQNKFHIYNRILF